MKEARDSASRSILIVAGEASGEMYAAELVEALQASSDFSQYHFFGCGGDRMRQLGVEILVDIHQLAVLGPFEALSHMVHFYSALRKLVSTTENRSPVLAILVDFPDFNLRLAHKLKVYDVPVIYFISPQVWAWRTGRMRQMKKVIDLMLVILPFEKAFYATWGMEVEYIGHPLVDRVKTSCSRSDFFRRYDLRPELPTISLLPGSRTKEIRYTMPTLLQTTRRLSWERPMQFLVPMATAADRALIEKLIADESPQLPVTILEQDTYNAVGYSDLAVVSSGTATLEAALLGTPLISVFRISNLTWIVGQYLVNVPYYSLVNLIAGKEVVPELFQNRFSAETLYTEMKRYLNDPALRKHAKIELAAVKNKLGEGGAIQRAAQTVRRWL